MTPSDQSNSPAAHLGLSAAQIKPSSTLIEEGGSTSAWLVADWTLNDIRYEWDWEFNEYLSMGDQLVVVWYQLRFTTAEELADEDRLYDLFGDWESYGVDTEIVYDRCKPGTPGAVKYWEKPR